MIGTGAQRGRFGRRPMNPRRNSLEISFGSHSKWFQLMVGLIDGTMPAFDSARIIADKSMKSILAADLAD